MPAHVGQVCSLVVGGDAPRARQSLFSLGLDFLSPWKDRCLCAPLYSHRNGPMGDPTRGVLSAPLSLGQSQCKVGLGSPAVPPRLPSPHPLSRRPELSLSDRGVSPTAAPTGPAARGWGPDAPRPL